MANNIFTPMGASNHVPDIRDPHDFYATDPKATEMLLELETFNSPILEPACGLGHIADVLKNHGYQVITSDIVKRGYEDKVQSFFDIKHWDGDIITNPPYKISTEFVEHALKITPNGVKIAMFLKLLFLESKKRKQLFEKYPPKIVYVSSSRLSCAKGGDFDAPRSAAIAYAWYVWEKGFKGDPIIKWFN